MNTSVDPEDFEDPLSNYDPPQFGSAVEAALAESTADAMQSRPYAEVSSGTPIRLAIHALHGLKVSCLLVVDNEQLVGIFTERDVLERVAEQYPNLADQPIREVMTTDPVVVYAHNPSGTALAAIAAAGYRHVPVVEADGRVAGIVSPRRVFSYLEDFFEAGHNAEAIG